MPALPPAGSFQERRVSVHSGPFCSRQGAGEQSAQSLPGVRASTPDVSVFIKHLLSGLLSNIVLNSWKSLCDRRSHGLSELFWDPPQGLRTTRCPEGAPTCQLWVPNLSQEAAQGGDLCLCVATRALLLLGSAVATPFPSTAIYAEETSRQGRAPR